MAFRGVLPEVPSFGAQVGRGLGAGLSKGIATAGDMASKLFLKKAEMNQRNQLINRIEGESKPQAQPPSDEEFIASLPEIESQLGRDLTPDDLQKLYPQWQKLMSHQNQQQSQQQEDPFRKAKMYAAAGEHELARVASEEAKIGEKRKFAQEERDYFPKKEYQQHAAKENIDFLTKIKSTENDIPQTDFSLAMIEDSLGNADKWAAAKDWMAENTGFVGFRSAAGAELDSAVKGYFLGDLSSIKGGRINQFLEKQIRDAYVKAGQDPISNQKIFLGMKLKKEIDALKVGKTRELESHFLEKQGYLPSGFESMVNKAITPEVNKIEKRAIDTLHHISKVEGERDKIFRAYLKSGEVLMMDQEGNPYAVSQKEVPMYKEQGYIQLGKKS